MGVIAAKAREPQARDREAVERGPSHPWASGAVYRLSRQPPAGLAAALENDHRGCAEPAPCTEPEARPLAPSPRPCVARGHAGCWLGVLNGKWGHGHPRPQWGCGVVRF